MKKKEEFCNEAVYIGDGNIDMEIVKTYRPMIGIGIAKSYSPRKPLRNVEKELRESGVEFIIHDIRECLQLLRYIESCRIGLI